jgi:hypothetical protein
MIAKSYRLAILAFPKLPSNVVFKNYPPSTGPIKITKGKPRKSIDEEKKN